MPGLPRGRSRGCPQALSRYVVRVISGALFWRTKTCNENQFTIIDACATASAVGCAIDIAGCVVGHVVCAGFDSRERPYQGRSDRRAFSGRRILYTTRRGRSGIRAETMLQEHKLLKLDKRAYLAEVRLCDGAPQHHATKRRSHGTKPSPAGRRNATVLG